MWAWFCLTLRKQDEKARNISTSFSHPTPPVSPSPFPDLLEIRHLRSFSFAASLSRPSFHSCGLWAGRKDHHEAEVPSSPRTWIDWPACPLLSAHLFKPAPFLGLLYLSFLTFAQRCSLSSSLEVLPHFPYGSGLYPFPSPRQPDAIGASSLRDPVPYLSLVCLPFLTLPSLLRPQGLRVPIEEIPSAPYPGQNPLVYPGSRAAQGKMKKEESSHLPI